MLQQTVFREAHIITCFLLSISHGSHRRVYEFYGVTLQPSHIITQGTLSDDLRQKRARASRQRGGDTAVLSSTDLGVLLSCMYVLWSQLPTYTHPLAIAYVRRSCHDASLLSKHENMAQASGRGRRASTLWRQRSSRAASPWSPVCDNILSTPLPPWLRMWARS